MVPMRSLVSGTPASATKASSCSTSQSVSSPRPARHRPAGARQVGDRRQHVVAQPDPHDVRAAGALAPPAGEGRAGVEPAGDTLQADVLGGEVVGERRRGGRIGTVDDDGAAAALHREAGGDGAEGREVAALRWRRRIAQQPQRPRVGERGDRRVVRGDRRRRGKKRGGIGVAEYGHRAAGAERGGIGVADCGHRATGASAAGAAGEAGATSAR